MEEITELEIGKIKVDEHFAKRLGEPSEKETERLTEDIRMNGILVPLLVTPKNLLLDGHRRLQVAKTLKMDTVPVRVLPSGDADEWERCVSVLVNLNRRYMNVPQRVALGTSLLRIERVKAKERQAEGQKSGGRGHKKLEAHGEPKVSDDGKTTARVAAQVGVSRGAFEHTMTVFKKSKPLAKKLLEDKISVAGAYKKVKVAELKDKVAAEPKDPKGLLKDLSEGAGKYRTIYADPPWKYEQGGKSGDADQHYPCMSLEDLCKKEFADKVTSLSHADGCHLWLWTTWPMIRDETPHAVLKAWGFKWVGEVVWKKDRMATGRWLRPITEVLILAVRGGLKMAEEPAEAYLEVPRGEHSVKPEEARQFVEKFSHGPRIELFARKATKDWDRWGLEA